MKEYKRLTNNNLDEYNPEYDFCMGCKYFGEPNGCNRPNGSCSNYERFIETYNRLAELEDKIENGTLIEFPCVRKINSPLGCLEAVYINESDLMQECIINTEKEGWLLVEKYGCPKHSAMAEQKLKEFIE